jgi:hypothetical protein
MSSCHIHAASQPSLISSSVPGVWGLGLGSGYSKHVVIIALIGDGFDPLLDDGIKSVCRIEFQVLLFS